MATNGRTIKWVIGGLVTIFIVVIGAITTLSTKADTKLDKDKLDCSVFNAHKEAQVAEFINVEKTQKQQITSLKEFNKQEFGMFNGH